MPNIGDNILPTKKMPSKEVRKTYVEAAVSTSGAVGWGDKDCKANV